jgi:di/tricarboxylate transporter
MEITLVLTILLIAIVLYATEWLRMDLVSLMVLLALGLTGMVTPNEAFAGFSNPAVITVAAMFVLSAGLTHTGALGPMGERLLQIAGNSELRMIAAIMFASALFSAFINNIGATAMLMPLVTAIAQKSRLSPSKLLIPLAFGSLLGGVCTLIGTPPNILVNELMRQHTGTEFGMFEFTPVGLAILATGVGFMLLFGRHLLPSRKAGSLTEAYQVKEYISEVELLPKSPLIGRTIEESGIQQDFKLQIRALLRDEQKFPFPHRKRVLRQGDILFLGGDPSGILQVRDKKGLQLVQEAEHPTPHEVDRDEIVVVEAALTPTSEMVGKTLRDVHFADNHGLTVLGIWRKGAPVVKKVDHVVMRFGDVLLLQGARERAIHLGHDHGFLLLGDVNQTPFRPRRGSAAILILLLVVGLAATGTMPIILSAPLGAFIMVLVRCLSIKEAYESIDWSIIVLIAGTLPLGIAMEQSGTARLLAELLLGVLGPVGPWAVLSGLFLVTFLLTAVMSNAATAVLIAPIAFEAAIELGVHPQPFYMAVAVAASASFLTPISHQSNALVMGPGGYRFIDFLKVGTPLNLCIWFTGSLLIPIVFPF